MIVLLILRGKGAIVINQSVGKVLMLNFSIFCWLKVIWVGSFFRYMISHSKTGPGRGSYIGGCSVHNQRIERGETCFMAVQFTFTNFTAILRLEDILMLKILFIFGPCSMFFIQELMNFCTGLLLDGMHIPSSHRIIKRQNNYGSLAWLEIDRRKYA